MELGQVEVAAGLYGLGGHPRLGGEEEAGLVGVAKLGGKVLCNQFEVLDPLAWNGPIAGVDDPQAAVWEGGDGGAHILDGVARGLLVEEVGLLGVDRDRLAHQVAHQVEHVDDLLDELAPGFFFVAPPGGMERVAEVAGAKKTDGAAVQGAQVLQGLTEAVHKTHLGFDAGLFTSLDHLPGLVPAQRDGFLDEQVNTALGGLLYLVGVAVGGEADDQDIQVGGLQHTGMVGEDLGLADAVLSG